ncbi:DUF6207 family protein [Streptomyces sp. NPDC090057]|uniref:DUF6207 family protein n=1 Tax=Streptomyces sp. NPDC090057 TaxID=3365935 RepID=UPI0038168C80
MDVINEAHVSEPGLIVVDGAAVTTRPSCLPVSARITVGDHRGKRIARGAGQPGVRLRCYPGMRQAPN